MELPASFGLLAIGLLEQLAAAGLSAALSLGVITALHIVLGTLVRLVPASPVTVLGEP